ncbi:NAD(P)-dependent oxidoreductase [Francisella sp. 19X1-34]|uniref:NAD-dependent epimerase/dehydratase family protein n=1 Tax=Francisella sp. 19X1-34 TaxID=3087177 RepID=UPI002E3473EC|nr:NAD(P)-dependent oxidoreductase [Francisella sp. 19X1-34]MED7787546.1 NAD(P)-dependent oxidoreductase [Francisella sp. 19X1-34]
MRSLVTGANGLLGRALIKELSKNGIVYALVRDKSKISFEQNENIIILEEDLKSFDEKRLPKNIDNVYYLAQSKKFREFPDGVEDMLHINIIAPNRLAVWSMKNNVKRFVYASTGGVYGFSDNACEQTDIIANNQLGYYPDTKLAAENLLINFSSSFEALVILRPFFIYGEGQEESMLIPRLISNIENRNEIALSGKDGIKINPIYATDAAKALLNIPSLKGKHIINIAGDEIVSLREILYIISDSLGVEPNIVVKDINQNNLVADSSIMRSMLAKPEVDLKAGINMMVKSK